MSVLWFLWKTRNRARFDGVGYETFVIISLVDGFVEQLGLAKKLAVSHFRGDPDDPWA